MGQVILCVIKENLVAFTTVVTLICQNLAEIAKKSLKGGPNISVPHFFHYFGLKFEICSQNLIYIFVVYDKKVNLAKLRRYCQRNDVPKSPVQEKNVKNEISCFSNLTKFG